MINLRTYHQIAKCEFYQDKIKEAKNVCVYILNQLTNDIKSSHVLVVDVKILLSRCLLSEGECDKARRTCEDAIEGANELINSHPLLVAARKTLDDCVKALNLNKPKEASNDFNV